ncbi:MAG: hypothetical protein HY880_00690 [Deltaproteobacteria bacterium]|nr:hypothetical protein [Deltaproteobacteria bacterium]
MSDKRPFLLTAALLAIFLSAAPSESKDVLVVGDAQLKPVSDIISGINATLDEGVKVVSLSDAGGNKLRSIAAKEEAKVVVALGKDALDEALQLPLSIAVIYDLVLTPPIINRPNTTGFYMATPVGEYIDLIKKYLPSIRKIAVVGSRDLMGLLDAQGPQIAAYNVRSSVDVVNAVRQADSVEAVLLLPDVSLLTSTALNEVFLLSFRKGIPIMGISEKNVRQGALLALVFDPVSVGRQIGETAAHALNGKDLGDVPPAPPRRFGLILNIETARRMGIRLSQEFIDKAKRTYP